MPDNPEEYLEQEDNELFEHFKFIADPGQKVMRIDRYLVDRMESTSRNRIQNAANSGCIFVNGKPVKANYKVKPNEVVTVMLDYPRRELKIIAEDIPLDVFYEDDQVIVINKQPGMVVHPGHGNYSGTLVNALAYRFQNLPLFNAEDPRPGLVHRIDKDTSGLLVVAKTEIAKTSLGHQFFEKSTKRRYQAVAWGVPKESEGRIEGHIGRSLKNRQVFTVFPDGDYGKHAVTNYTVLKELGYVSLVECRLETGRTHQIRVHMKHINHPLFNDSTYGGNVILRGTTFSKYKQFVDNCFKICPRQALHAKMLGFVHPTTGKEMIFEIDLANDMQQLVDKWEAYVATRE